MAAFKRFFASISTSEVAQRRDALLRAIPVKSQAIISGYGLRYATQGIFYPFHQSTNFYYLTGITEPDACLTLDSTTEKYSLFLHPNDPFKEKWDGKRIGLEGAIKNYGMDNVSILLIDNLDTISYKGYPDYHSS